MYVDASTVRTPTGKSYTRYLLRTSYRKQGKVKHDTIANLSSCSLAEIEAIRLALRHKQDLTALVSLKDDFSLEQGLSVGAVWTVFDVAKRLGVIDALGSTRAGKRALWQVIARVIDQGSRLSAVRLAGSHAACDVLNLTKFNEDDLYDNLGWLTENQAKIEDRLFTKRNGRERDEDKQQLFLYDVTSSYLEGTKNALAAFGYNRDKKKGKRQIVIGLLCDETGIPLSIEVFKGNTKDPQTVASQVNKVVKRFGGGEVTFVGDRGMIKSEQIEDLNKEKFHYITAITKPQIKKLLKTGVIQMSLFDQQLAEVETDEGIRYVLRLNPIRAMEVRQTRQEKLTAVQKEVDKQNLYLAEHARAHVEVARRKVREKIERLKLSEWLSEMATDREISLTEDSAALAEEAKLDGCYVLKTDLDKDVATKETIHARYKDLALVEWAFRTSKTVTLEVRPVHVRTESHTRGHVFVVMLSYLIIAELARCWQDLDVTVNEGISQLDTICATRLLVKGEARCNQIPQPRPLLQQLLKAAQVTLPEVLPSRGVTVTTRKKLTSRRKKR
ncbi:MAG: IS1634 family transposase [Candidatus Bipolaricaulota bacterium]|nr:IS1634 family transposase [Candidatus Bipolaricaulota bacterium]